MSEYSAQELMVAIAPWGTSDCIQPSPSSTQPDATRKIPLPPGEIVRNESVPSGLWRLATSVFHSPKSNT